MTDKSDAMFAEKRTEWRHQSKDGNNIDCGDAAAADYFPRQRLLDRERVVGTSSCRSDDDDVRIRDLSLHATAGETRQPISGSPSPGSIVAVNMMSSSVDDNGRRRSRNGTASSSVAAPSTHIAELPVTEAEHRRLWSLPAYHKRPTTSIYNEKVRSDNPTVVAASNIRAEIAGSTQPDKGENKAFIGTRQSLTSTDNRTIIPDDLRSARNNNKSTYISEHSPSTTPVSEVVSNGLASHRMLPPHPPPPPPERPTALFQHYRGDEPCIAFPLGSVGNPLSVGSVDVPGARRLRLVHISDTHSAADLIQVPDGDILVHSGDFLQYTDCKTFEADTAIMNEFFGKLPHRYKIFVAGNHEMKFIDKSADAIRARLPNVIYLQDSGCVLEGLRVYGSPWCTSRGSPAYAFSVTRSRLREAWSRIPVDTDLLVTHSPPKNIMDDSGSCGCEELRRAVFDGDLRISMHMFGHAHHRAEVQLVAGIWFSNGTQGACQLGKSLPVVVDFYVDPTRFDNKTMTTDDGAKQHNDREGSTVCLGRKKSHGVNRHCDLL